MTTIAIVAGVLIAAYVCIALITGAVTYLIAKPELCGSGFGPLVLLPLCLCVGFLWLPWFILLWADRRKP